MNIDISRFAEYFDIIYERWCASVEEYNNAPAPYLADEIIAGAGIMSVLLSALSAERVSSEEGDSNG